MTRKRSAPPTTIKQVAAHLGVAISSVSRALNDHPDVSEDMKQRVLAAAEELGYEPDFLGQSLRRGATRIIGFNVRDISNPLFADIVRGADDYIKAAGYSLLLTNADQNPKLDLDHIKLFRQRRVDGLILSLQSESQPGLVDLVESLDFPVVLVDRELPDIKISGVVCDGTGMKQAVQHLLSLGHQRIALVSGPEDLLTTRERLAGYRAAFDTQGLAVDPTMLRLESYNREFAHAQTLDLLGGENPPTAIIAGGLRLLNGTLAACRQASVRIGDDVSIVGCDEIELMSYLSPQISVIRRNPQRMGRLAAEILIDQLENDVAPRTAVVPTEYAPRASTMPPPKVKR